MTTPQKRAAKTRAQNKAAREMYEQYTKPAHQKVESILNFVLGEKCVFVYWIGERRLKGGVDSGRLISIAFGGLEFKVYIEGYAKPQEFSSRFWSLERPTHD